MHKGEGRALLGCSLPWRLQQPKKKGMWKAQKANVWIEQDCSHVHIAVRLFFRLEGQRERETQRTEGATYAVRHIQRGVRGVHIRTDWRHDRVKSPITENFMSNRTKEYTLVNPSP